MRCTRLTLQNFRAYDEGSVAFGQGINLVYGANGVGKTNLIEALGYLGLGKSFLTHSDTYAVRQGAAHFEINGEFEGERRGAFRIRLRVAPGEGKLVWVNGAPLATLAELVGRVPLVLMTPQDYALTSGPPEERRRFINTLLSQAQPVYLDDLLRYNRALRQRNELLTSARRRRAPSDDLLGAWTEEVTVLGARVIEARRAALHTFTGHLNRAYDVLGGQVEKPALVYAETSAAPPEAEVEPFLRARFDALGRRERETGRTLAGPHRDDLMFSLDGMEVRRYASQGQHRTYGIALRLAQYFYLREQVGESPILLLDDLFGSLDAERTAAMETLLLSDEAGQVIVTDTSPNVFSEAVAYDDEHRRVHLTETLRTSAKDA